jgi:hypothetical protein
MNSKRAREENSVTSDTSDQDIFKTNVKQTKKTYSSLINYFIFILCFIKKKFKKL